MNTLEPLKRSLSWPINPAEPPHKIARTNTPTITSMDTKDCNSTHNDHKNNFNEKDHFLLRKNLVKAIESNNIDMIRESIRMGVDVNGTNPKNGESFLVTSVYDTFRLEACEELLSHGPDLDAETDEVGTALHAAVLVCNPDAARSLVLAGFDPFKPRACDGLSPLDLIQDRVNPGSTWLSDEIKRYRSLWLECQNLP